MRNNAPTSLMDGSSFTIYESVKGFFFSATIHATCKNAAVALHRSVQAAKPQSSMGKSHQS